MAAKKTIYGLKTRLVDAEKWSPAEYYASEKERDGIAAQCRIIGGIRTHSFEERVSSERARDLCGQE
jgi:hypothetical protein